MMLRIAEEFISTGDWFFRKRGCLPLLYIAIFGLAVWGVSYPLRSRILGGMMWGLFCLFVSLCGLAVRGLTLGWVPQHTSGRNTQKGQVADTLNNTGMYSIVRHPLYLGNLVILSGISLFMGIWWAALICILSYIPYLERIMFAEEAFLLMGFGGEYLVWARQTPAIFPRLRLWKRPSLPFSFKTVLKKEYLTLFMITSIFGVMGIIRDTVAQKRFILDWVWITIFISGLAAFIILRVLRKWTRVLHVEGR